MSWITRTAMKYRVPGLRRWLPSIEKSISKVTWTGGYKVVKARGALFLVDRRNLVDRSVGMFGGYEQEQLDHLQSVADQHGCDLFLDIGANLGYYTVVMAKHQAVKQVISFEADARSFHHLCANLYLNGLALDNIARHQAVADANGTLRFNLNADNDLGSSHIANEGDTQTIEVESVRIDDAVDVTQKTVIVKMDIEGHELPALTGMAALLKNNRCCLQIESAIDKVDAVKTFMSDQGYTHRKSFGQDHYFDNFE